jgi:universal stress protein E
VLKAAAQRSQAQLEKAVARARLRQPRVTCIADWDYPAFEAVVRQAVKRRAELVVAVVRPHRAGARVFLRNVDWELIRHCPVPLLLLKSNRSLERAPVLVAVDPLHAADKPARLDRSLLGLGARVARHVGGRLHMVHAWQPLSVAMPVTGGWPGPVWMPPEAEAAHEKSLARAFDRLASAARVPPAQRYLHVGTVPDVFAKALKKSRARVLVMGAISRRGIARLLIGNTAERMLDSVPCDVLVVKPAAFRNRVPNKVRGPTPGVLVPPL